MRAIHLTTAVGLGSKLVHGLQYPYLDLVPINSTNDVPTPTSTLRKRDDFFWSLSFHDGGCGGKANYGAYNNQAVECYNLAQDLPWDSIVVGTHPDTEVFLFESTDCCTTSSDYPCSIYKGFQDGTCVNSVGHGKPGRGFAKSVSVIYATYKDSGPQGPLQSSVCQIGSKNYKYCGPTESPKPSPSPQPIKCASGSVEANAGDLFCISNDGQNISCDECLGRDGGRPLTSEFGTCYFATESGEHKDSLGNMTACPGDPPPDVLPDGSANKIAESVVDTWCGVAGTGGAFGWINFAACYAYTFGYKSRSKNELEKQKQGINAVCDVFFSGLCTCIDSGVCGKNGGGSG